MSNPGAGAEPGPADSQPDNGSPVPFGPARFGMEGSPEALDSAEASPKDRSIPWLHRFRKTLRIASRPKLVAPNFAPYAGRYLFQAGLATVAMLALQLFVDSLSQAALVAALGVGQTVPLMPRKNTNTLTLESPRRT